MHRNGLRLLKLVNTLLDFRASKAGRFQAVYSRPICPLIPAELAKYAFRSAIEQAGLDFTIDCAASFSGPRRPRHVGKDRP